MLMLGVNKWAKYSFVGSRDSYFQLLLKNDGLYEQVFLLSLFNVILSAFMCHLNSSIENYLMLNQEDLKLDGTAENKYLKIILILFEVLQEFCLPAVWDLFVTVL